VVDDFDDLRIETVAPIRGAWPPPTGTLLIEQTALPVLGAVTNGPLNVQMPSGRTSSIAVAGVVSDRALAPAWQEQRGYAYITPDTLAWLGEPPTLDQLKISVADEDRFDADAIERTARGLSGWLQTQGHAVEEIRIPPPGEHPHQRLMNALVTVLLLFSALLLALSAVVIATLVTGMLSRHVRQIGAMKAIGSPDSGWRKCSPRSRTWSSGVRWFHRLRTHSRSRSACRCRCSRPRSPLSKPVA